MPTKQLPQRSAEWFEARKKIDVSGSTIACLTGDNPWMTEDDLIRQKVRDRHNAESEFTGNKATNWGTEHEPLALEIYEQETGNLVTEHGLIIHPEVEYVGYSPDGTHPNGLLEIKCPYSQVIPEDVPTHYYQQVQLGMEVMDLSKTELFYWTPMGTWVFEIDRDPVWWDTMLPLIKKFHNRLNKEMDNPIHLEPKYDSLKGADVELAAMQWRKSKAVLEAATEAEKRDKQALIKLAHERSAKGYGVTITKAVRKGPIKYSDIPELSGVDLDGYRGKSTTYFTIKQDKEKS